MARQKTGGIQRRGDAWRISYFANGRRQWETFPTEEEAIRELAQRIADDAKGVPVSSRPNTVLFGELCADVLNEYKVNERRSLKSWDSRMEKHVVPTFGARKAATITTSQLNAYIVMRQAKTPKPAVGTINRELEAIRHVFKLAMQGGKLLRMPHVPHLRENNARKGFFTAGEVEGLVRQLGPTLGLFVRFGFLTGWRKSEISELKWSNVDFGASEIRLDPGTTKNGHGRTFPMTAELRQLLTDARKAKDRARNLRRGEKTADQVPTLAPNVFLIDGRPVLEFRKTWRNACFKAGLPCVVDQETGKLLKALRIFHDLRRSAVKRMIGEGIPERVIMQICGWESRSIFDRYSIVGEADLEIARTRMENGAKHCAKSTKTGQGLG